MQNKTLWAARSFCLVIGLLSVGLALPSIFNPEKTATLVGFTIAKPFGTVEIMALYGGFYGGYGVFLVLAPFIRNWLSPALALIGISGLGAAGLRLYGIFNYQPDDSLVYNLLIGESIMAVGGFLFLWLLSVRQKT